MWGKGEGGILAYPAGPARGNNHEGRDWIRYLGKVQNLRAEQNDDQLPGGIRGVDDLDPEDDGDDVGGDGSGERDTTDSPVH